MQRSRLNTRRQFISHTMGSLGILSLGSSLEAMTSAQPFLKSDLSEMGGLRPPNDMGARLPDGYELRVIAESGKPVSLVNGKQSKYIWHGAPDGGACFSSDDGGWVYVSNAELSGSEGGVGAIRFNANGEVVDAYSILSGTTRNCAGGPTPWNTWLSCEEFSLGAVYECDPYQESTGIKRPALGYFQHEAAAVDPDRGHIYMTEDQPDGCLYRYTPATISSSGVMDLGRGRLEVAVLDGKRLSWQQVTNPNPGTFQTSTRHQVKNAAHFNGGEGIWYHRKLLFFTTKGDNRVWMYHTQDHILTVIYDPHTSKTPILSGVDNITVSSSGKILVGEDGGDMQIVVLSLDGTAKPLLQLLGQDHSEITGPAINPGQQRLYFSSQRGPKRGSSGITYELIGRFS